MGNKLSLFKEEEPQAPAQPAKPAPTPAEILALKAQFLECWTVEDVVEWLQFHSFEEFVEIANQLILDGDALTQLYSFLSASSNDAVSNEAISTDTTNNSNENNNNNNNNENATIPKKNKINKPAIPVSPYFPEVIKKLETVNNEKVANLLEVIRDMVGKYEVQFGAQSTKEDEEYPPYEYPKFEDENEPNNRNELVMFYHHNTQHTKNGGSRSVERRWFAQPRIFRRYFGAPYTRLEIPTIPSSPSSPSSSSSSSSSSSISTPYNNLYFSSPSSSSALSSKTLSEFLFYSLSVSGRRDLWTLTSSPRSAWVKRVNPSSGGLHPIETYLILPPGILNKTEEKEKEGGVYHYAVRHHALEKRYSFSNSEFSELDSILQNGENFVVGVSSIHWREVWKYGERGFRYCMLDAGHALGSLAVSAARLGWKITLLPSIATDDVESILGLSDSNQFISPVERERGLILAVVNTNGKDVTPSLLPGLQRVLKNAKWEGAANHLSADHKDWDIVSKVDNLTKVENIDQDQIAKVTSAPKEETSTTEFSFRGKEEEPAKGVAELQNLSESMTLENVINSRRSALDYINKPISLDQFVHILFSIYQSDKVLNLPWPATANLFFFAYQITDLPSGIYALVRNTSEIEELKKTTEEHRFAWTTPSTISSLPFYLLKEIPKEELSKTSFSSSCSQHIASQGAFSVGMFVNIEKIMKNMGPSGYSRAHFECGSLGQLLYLEAHALGLGATGMGCYLDDLARNTFGLQNSPFWSLYHFAIGVPSIDNRYTPYDYNDNMFAGVLEECVGFLTDK